MTPNKHPQPMLKKKLKTPHTKRTLNNINRNVSIIATSLFANHAHFYRLRSTFSLISHTTMAPIKTTTNSPMPTVKYVIQNGVSLTRCNSSATAHDIKVQIIIVAPSLAGKDLKNFPTYQLNHVITNVCRVPKIISTGPIDDHKLAIKHPKVTPQI